MDRPLLSLCVIARDEADVLARALRSAAPFVDESLVVDTGSADGTPELAIRHGARVIRHPWRDDFAEARNVAIDAAGGRFLLMLDADEAIAGGPAPAALRARLDRERAEAWTVTIADRLDTGGDRRYPLVRLFRNRPEHRYTGAIHEQITPAIARRAGVGEVEPADSGLIVAHDGYLAERRARHDKARRNVEMLRRRVAAAPDDAVGRYFLLRESIPVRGGRAVPGGHLAAALAHAGAAPGLPPKLAVDRARLEAAALLALGRPGAAQRVLRGAGSSDVALELLRADAEIALAGADRIALERALARLEFCFDREGPGDLPFHEPALAGAVAHAHTAEVLARLGRVVAGRQRAREATALPGGGAAGWNALAAVERAAGDLPSALRAYLAGAREDPHDPWTWAGIGDLLLAAGDAASALEPLRNAAALAPGWGRVEGALAAARRGTPAGDPSRPPADL